MSRTPNLSSFSLCIFSQGSIQSYDSANIIDSQPLLNDLKEALMDTQVLINVDAFKNIRVLKTMVPRTLFTLARCIQG